MSVSLQPYNISLPSFSPVFIYEPQRDGPPNLGWNSSYSVGPQPLAFSPYGIVGQGIAYHVTQYDGASISLGFEGTAVYFCVSEGTSALYTFLVDGTQISTTGDPTDAACANYGGLANVLLVANALDYGVHNVTLLVHVSNAIPQVQFFGATVTVGAGERGAKTTQVIDDSKFQYTSGWYSADDDPLMWNGEYQVSCDYSPNSIASYTFTGADAVMLHGLSLYDDYGFTVTLSNQPPVIFNASDTYWRHSSVLLFFAGGLNNTDSYTITIANYDPNQPNPPTVNNPNNVAGTACATVDKLVLVQDDLSSTINGTTGGAPPPVSSTLSIGWILAIVFASLLFLVLVALVYLVLYWRRRYRKLAERDASIDGSILDGIDPTPWSDRNTFTAVAQNTSELSLGFLPVGSPDTALNPPNARVPPEVVAISPHSYPRLTTHSAETKAVGQLDRNTPPVSRAPEEIQLARRRPSARSDTSSSQQVPPISLTGEMLQTISAVVSRQLQQEYTTREGIGQPPAYVSQPDNQ
ncbi:hypothetical protein CALVIDRAFT_341578 [Calocera viscosa TUFC12733]|uniref:Transmembrane protein n=1 Tax=Calocera viscosa (strain TUFC12733) TaxID=1330018 RepID=A0A167HET7_CALVF|nr:hypothetical protein CALVIDRAFT_341578 [Calocera viscosa TUFC12733]